MAKVRKVDYFVMHVRHHPGEGARLLRELKRHDVALLAFMAFPTGEGAQVDLVPEDARAFVAAAERLGWKLHSRKVCFLVRGKDRAGALVKMLDRLGEAGINVTALSAVIAGKDRFGAMFWVGSPDVAKAARVVEAR